MNQQTIQKIIIENICALSRLFYADMFNVWFRNIRIKWYGVNGIYKDSTQLEKDAKTGLFYFHRKSEIFYKQNVKDFLQKIRVKVWIS